MAIDAGVVDGSGISKAAASRRTPKKAEAGLA
jgi:hypothetical protein